MARVLLVEPDRPIRKFIAGILSDLGHHVAQAKSLGDFRDWVGRDSFDVVATDLVLGETGEQIASAARDMKIVTLSGCLFDRDEQLDQTVFRDRPFRLDNLRMLVSNLEIGSGRRMLAA